MRGYAAGLIGDALIIGGKFGNLKEPFLEAQRPIVEHRHDAIEHRLTVRIFIAPSLRAT